MAGQALAPAYKGEDLGLVRKGTCNLAKHVQNTRKFGVPVVVAINAFATDTDAELDAVAAAAREAGRCSLHAAVQGMCAWDAALYAHSAESSP